MVIKLFSQKKNKITKINYKNFKTLINKINYLDLMFEKNNNFFID